MLQSHIVQYFTKRYLKKFCAAALPFIPGVPLTALCGDFLGFRNNFLFEYPTQHMNNYKLNTTHEYPTFSISNTTHENRHIYNPMKEVVCIRNFKLGMAIHIFE